MSFDALDLALESLLFLKDKYYSMFFPPLISSSHKKIKLWYHLSLIEH